MYTKLTNNKFKSWVIVNQLYDTKIFSLKKTNTPNELLFSDLLNCAGDILSSFEMRTLLVDDWDTICTLWNGPQVKKVAWEQKQTCSTLKSTFSDNPSIQQRKLLPSFSTFMSQTWLLNIHRYFTVYCMLYSLCYT